MRDIAAVEFGAKMTEASSHHSKFLPKNILDREAAKPWISTGLYPQFFVISFPDLMQIHTIDIRSYNVRVISVERCATEAITGYEPVSEKQLGRTVDKLQEENLTNHEFPARHLRFVIRSGFDSFCAVNGVRVMGLTMSGRSPMPIRKFDVAKMLPVTSPETSKRRSLELPAKKTTLDVVDSDLYPRHIATGPAVYEETRFEAILEDETEKRRRFQSAFRVPKQKRVFRSSVTKLESGDESGNEFHDESVDPRFNIRPSSEWH